MKRVEAILDWFIIVTFPIGLWLFWTADNVAMLRFMAMWWFVSVTVQCTLDRYKARLERELQRRMAP